MILNIGQEGSPFDVSSDVDKGSIEHDDYETDLVMPRTESLIYEEAQQQDEMGIAKPQISNYNVLPKFDKGAEQADDESGLRSKANTNGTLEHGLNQLMSPQQQSSGAGPSPAKFTFQGPGQN